MVFEDKFPNPLWDSDLEDFLSLCLEGSQAKEEEEVQGLWMLRGSPSARSSQAKG